MPIQLPQSNSKNRRQVETAGRHLGHLVEQSELSQEPGFLEQRPLLQPLAEGSYQFLVSRTERRSAWCPGQVKRAPAAALAGKRHAQKGADRRKLRNG